MFCNGAFGGKFQSPLFMDHRGHWIYVRYYWPFPIAERIITMPIDSSPIMSASPASDYSARLDGKSPLSDPDYSRMVEDKSPPPPKRSR